MRVSSKVFIAAAVVIGLPLLALGALPFLVDANRYRPLVQEQLEGRLHRPVSLGDLRLKAFPLSLRVADVVIGQPPGFSSPEPFLQAKELSAGVALFPLLRKQVDIDSVQLTSPRIELVRNPDGHWNYETGPSAGSGGLSLKELRIADGQLAVTDRKAASPREVYEHIEATVRGLGSDGPGSLAGSVRLDSMAALVTIKTDFRLAEELAAKGTLTLKADRAKEPVSLTFDVLRPNATSPMALRSVVAKAGAISADIQGSLDTNATPAGLDLNVKTAHAPIAELTHLAALYGAQFPEDLRATGLLTAAIHVTGTTQKPLFAGMLDVTKAEIGAKALSEPVKASELHVDFTPVSLSTRPFTVETGATRLTAKVGVSDYAGPSPRVTGMLQTNGAKVEELLRIATAYGVRPAGLNGSGLVTLDMNVADQGNTLSYSGSGTLRDVSLTSPELPRALIISSAGIRFSNDRIGFENLKAALGNMHVDGECSVRGLAHPDLQFNAHIDEVNVPELRQWKIASAKPAAKNQSSLTANGTLSIDKITDESIVLSNVKASVNYAGNILKLDPLTAGIFGGQTAGSITADLRDGLAPVYAIRSRLANVDANKLLSATTAVKNVLTGALSGNVDLRCTVRPGANIAKELNGGVQFQMGQGSLAGVHILDEISSIGRFMGYSRKQSGTTRIVKLAGSLNIVNGVANTNDLFMDLDGGTLSGAGTIGLVDQTLNLRVTTVLNKDFAKQAGQIGGLLSTVLGNQNGELVVPARVTGTFAQPKFLPDPERVASLKLNGLLPTSGNPAALSSGIMGLVNGLTGKGAAAQPGAPEAPLGGLNDLIDQFRKKKPEKK